MKNLNTYQQTIIDATNCDINDVEEIEDYMRNIIFHSTLDWQTKTQLNAAAKTAHSDILWMRLPEGIKYMEQLQNLNHETRNRNML